MCLCRGWAQLMLFKIFLFWKLPSKKKSKWSKDPLSTHHPDPTAFNITAFSFLSALSCPVTFWCKPVLNLRCPRHCVILALTRLRFKTGGCGGARLAQSVERATLDLGIVSSSPTLGLKLTLKKKFKTGSWVRGKHGLHLSSTVTPETLRVLPSGAYRYPVITGIFFRIVCGSDVSRTSATLLQSNPLFDCRLG